MVLRFIVFILMAFSAGLHADVSFEDMVGEIAPITDEAERERIQQQIAADRQAAKERQRQAASAQQAALKLWQNQQAQRPIEEQRVEQRCLTCHTPELLLQQPRSLLHWGLVVQRMKWFNGADVPIFETYSIAKHLAEQNPVSQARRWADVVFVIPLLGLIAVILLLARKLKQSDRRKDKI